MSTCPACGGIIGRDCFNPEECMGITRQQAAAHRDSSYEQEFRGAADDAWKYRTCLNSLVSYALTCKGENTTEWMEGLVDKINEACRVLDDTSRFAVSDTMGNDWIEKVIP